MSEFSVREALDWLGLTWEQYEQVQTICAGRHGNPVVDALLDVRYAYQREATTPAEVLAAHSIDPADPAAAARRYDSQRAAYDA